MNKLVPVAVSWLIGVAIAASAQAQTAAAVAPTASAQVPTSITWTDPVSKNTGTVSVPAGWKVTCAPACAAPTAPSAATISPDGTISQAPNGPKLITSADTWSWGDPAPGRPNEWYVLRNAAAAPGIAQSAEIAHGGKVYVKTATGAWYLWTGSNFSEVAAP